MPEQEWLKNDLESKKLPKEKIESESQKLPVLSNGNLNTQTENRFTPIIENYRNFFQEYDKVLDYLTIDDTIKSFIEKKRSWISRLEEEDFPVAFLGSFSAGKSTIINGILERDLLPRGVDPKTAFPTIIRKGKEDSALIHYIDENTKKEIWSKKSSEIGIKIEKNLNQETNETLGKHLERIRKLVDEYEKANEPNKIESKPLEILKLLLAGWNDTKYKALEKSVKVADLNQYIEGHQDALFIDRIEVTLLNLTIPENIVLVDLPGLNVTNEHHVEFTRKYIQEKAKAFVVCMKPNSLLEGQEKIFLNETNSKNPTILERSFWVINKWDSLYDEEKKQEEKNFGRIKDECNFKIKDERFFKISALTYLLLSCIANGTIDKTISQDVLNHLDKMQITATKANDITPEQAKQLLENEQVKPFFGFRQELINYLDKQAKDEFINNARNELLQAIVTVQENLKLFADVSKDDNGKSEEEIQIELRITEVVKKLHAFVESLTEQIKDFTTQIRNNAKTDFWDNEYTIEVEKEIDKKFSQVNKENLKTELIRGTDYEILLSRLASEIDKNIRLNLLLREKLVLSIKSFFVERQNQLLFELRDVNKDYLPSQTFDLLKDKLSRRDIEMRLNGLADFLFFDYSEKIDDIGKNFISSISIENKSHKTIIDEALETYQKELKEFTKKLKDNINKYVARSVKNYTEYLENELLNILIEQEEFIVQQITRKIDISEVATSEKNRRNTINNAYSVLTQLSNEL